MKSIHYYVVYSSGSIIGSCHLALKQEIKNMEDVNLMSDFISNKWCNNQTVIILNWKELEKE